ncbi:MAG TPA: serine protease, partial [Hyphomicrobiales bacterium]|nr:serine protease [Hyphomicrobiales bacterium]
MALLQRSWRAFAPTRVAAIAAAAVIGWTAIAAAPARAQGPASVADIAEGLVDAVVNISTRQTVKAPQGIP